MATIERVEIRMVSLEPAVPRRDAIQSFARQETPMVTVIDADGARGTGYSYTIGTGGPAVMSLIGRTLAPRLVGRDAERIEGVWRDLLTATHATAVGAITSLALAAIDTALWDLRCRRAGLPLWRLAGGARERIRVYTTEGGWLNLDEAALVEQAREARRQGFLGTKMKIGKPSAREDGARMAALRAAVGDDFAVMVDANQAFDLAEALRRAPHLEAAGIHWFEEPMPADRVRAHRRLAEATRVPIAVGESLYSLAQFNEYLAADAASVVQVDVARVGGITPWLKTAALAEAHGLCVAPHFLMELHLPLTCAVPNAAWLEHIPQLDPITAGGIVVEDGHAIPSDAPGLGIEWDEDAIAAMSEHVAVIDDAQAEAAE